MKKFYSLLSATIIYCLASAQNVGIGTATPLQKLHVEGMSYLNGNVGINVSSPGFPISFGPALGDKISLWSNSTNSYGFGIQSSQLQIHTDISAADIVFGYGSSAVMTETMRVKGNGNVGIGISAPLAKLHVNGNLHADTVRPNALRIIANAGPGKVLTSDVNGNASWQERSGSVGFGAWGDCSTSGISEYNPVADPAGEIVDRFGASVSISGSFAIIGSPYDDLTKGSASIYQYNGANWVFMQKLTESTGVSGDAFGLSVAISGNYAIVGAPYATVGANAYQGYVSLFRYNGTSWVYTQKILDLSGDANDYFGTAVSLSGIYAIVGAPGSDASLSFQGSASFYLYNGSSWVFMQRVTDAAGATLDLFGNSVAISNNYAIVGSPEDDDGAGSNQGSVSIYLYNGSSWVLVQKTFDNSPAANDIYGSSVSMSGDYVVVGIPGNNSGQGSASVYKYNGSAWIWTQEITALSGAAADYFGRCVSVSGNYIIVGADNDDVGTNGNQGSATIFVKVGYWWQRVQYVTDPAGVALEYLGSTLAIDGSTQRFLIGVPYYASQSGKVIFGKVN